MKNILYFLVLLLSSAAAFADTSINGRWLDYYEEGDSIRISNGVSLSTKEDHKRVGAYIKTGLWTWDLSNSILTFKVKSSNWKNVKSAVLVVSSSGLKFEKAATLDIKHLIGNATSSDWIEVTAKQDTWIIDGAVNWSKINSFLFAMSSQNSVNVTVEISNITSSKNDLLFQQD